MTYAPNEDGLMYFYREILPLIRQTIPTVKFYIVGKDPSHTVQKLAAENVIVTGKVPDLLTYYSLAQVSICPIRFGAGTLNKVIEPIAMGIPVVSTSISCVGMNVTPIQDPHFASADYQDRDIVFADTPETFAQSVINLLQQPELRQKIGAAAIKLVKAEHDWESIVAKLERIYTEIVSIE
jgi:polysaccharide biosynthesis protein PslH